MSIVTRTGDAGTTGLMYNRRLPKDHPRVDAYGTVDELNAALGMAKAFHVHENSRDILQSIQKDLVGVMGELATASEDQERYKKDGYSCLAQEQIERMEDWIRAIEKKGVRFEGWATPGSNPSAACLDMARTVCRRAERKICRLLTTGESKNEKALIFLNRLSDLLWLMARDVEV